MPYILEFSALYSIRHGFSHLVMPSDEHFIIDKEATKVNGWTKEQFLKDINGKELSFKEVWIQFLEWLDSIGLDNLENIYLCAYNGYKFDFRVLIHELRRFGIYSVPNFKLLDPWIDWVVLKKQDSEKLVDRFKKMTKNSYVNPIHKALEDCKKLNKVFTSRAISSESLTMTMHDYIDIFC